MTVSEKLRLVYGLHHHAEMFGFNWDDDSDWTWHDVACKIADEVDAENAKLRELVARLIRHIENPPCESCMAEMSCAGGEGLTNCDEYQFMVCDARELGVEVDE